MKICQLYSNYLPVTSGGVEKHVETLSDGLLQAGHEVFLLVPRYDSLPKIEKNCSIRIIRLGNGLPFKCSNTRYVGSLFTFYSNNIDFLSRAWSFLSKDNFGAKLDLIHAHTDGIGFFGFSSRNGYYLSKWLKKPLVLSFHQKIGEVPGDLPAKPERYKKYFDQSSQIIVHRKQNLRYLCKWGYKDKTTFIPIPIDINNFKKPANYNKKSDKIKVLYVGRLDHRRGIIPLIKSFDLVHKENKNVELHVIGYGLLAQEAKELSTKLCLNDCVVFHGKKFDLRKYYWDSDIYVSLNISDNYPSLSLREAMAAQMVPLVSDVGETSELISSGKNGLLVDKSSSTAIADAVLTLSEDPKLRAKLAANARLSSEEFSITNQRQFFIDIYTKAIGK